MGKRAPPFSWQDFAKVLQTLFTTYYHFPKLNLQLVVEAQGVIVRITARQGATKLFQTLKQMSSNNITAIMARLNKINANIANLKGQTRKKMNLKQITSIFIPLLYKIQQNIIRKTTLLLLLQWQGQKPLVYLKNGEPKAPKTLSFQCKAKSIL